MIICTKEYSLPNEVFFKLFVKWLCPRKIISELKLNSGVEAEFWRDCGINKHRHSVQCASLWFLDPVITKDFFERFQDYQAKYDIIVLKPELFLTVQTIKYHTSV